MSLLAEGYLSRLKYEPYPLLIRIELTSEKNEIGT